MLLERFERQLNKKRDNTKITFITAINQMYKYFNIADDEKQVKDITAFQLEDYIEELKKVYKLSTVNTKVAAIKSFFKYLVEANYITQNPSMTIAQENLIESSEYEVKEKEILTVEELQELLNKFDVKSKFCKEKTYLFNRARNKFITLMLYTTGCRISELLDRKLEDVKEYKDITIYIELNKKQVKNKIDKILVASKKTFGAYKEYIKVRKEMGIVSEYLICSLNGSKLSTANINSILNKTCDKHITAHCFRHSASTRVKQLLMQGKIKNITTVNNLLGWKSEVGSMFERYSGHLNEEYIKQLYELTNNIF